MDYCENCSKNWSNSINSNDHLQLTYLNQQQKHRRNHRSMNECSSNDKTLLNRLSSSYRFNLVFSSLLLVLLATLIPLSSASSTCNKHEYWDISTDQCTLCTKCNQHEIVIRPCQRHMNTVCKTLNTYEIDFSKALASDIPPRHHHQHHQQSTESFSAEASTLNEDELIWDWQMVSLVLAVVACLLFFVGTAYISINYIRQWRKIKKQFDNDVEGLSQQLMARLAMPTLEGSTIFIDVPTTKRSALGPRQIEVRCVYLEDILDGKESVKNSDAEKQRSSIGPAGNVYINDHKKQHHHMVAVAGHKRP